MPVIKLSNDASLTSFGLSLPRLRYACADYDTVRDSYPSDSLPSHPTASASYSLFPAYLVTDCCFYCSMFLPVPRRPLTTPCFLCHFIHNREPLSWSVSCNRSIPRRFSVLIFPCNLCIVPLFFHSIYIVPALPFYRNLWYNSPVMEVYANLFAKGKAR